MRSRYDINFASDAGYQDVHILLIAVFLLRKLNVFYAFNTVASEIFNILDR